MNQQNQSFNLLLKATKTCWRRFVKIWLVVPPLFLHAKQWLTRLLSANQRMCANQLSVQRPANSIPIQCVNEYQLDCIRDGNTIVKLKDSQLARTNLAPLRIWLCHTFNKLDQIAKLRVMSQNPSTLKQSIFVCLHKRRLIASV